MKGYLIETGTEIKTIHADGKMYHGEASFPTILPFSVVNAMAIDSIRTAYSDVVEFFYVNVGGLTVVDLECPEDVFCKLKEAAQRGKK